MSFLILIGPGKSDPVKYIALGIHMIVATAYLVSFFAAGFCYFGLIPHRSPVKWLLIAESILGVLALPVALFMGLDSPFLVNLLCYLAGLSALLLVNTLALFYYMDKTMYNPVKS